MEEEEKRRFLFVLCTSFLQLSPNVVLREASKGRRVFFRPFTECHAVAEATGGKKVVPGGGTVVTDVSTAVKKFAAKEAKER